MLSAGHPALAQSRWRLRLPLASLTGMAMAVTAFACPSTATASETRGYVVSWFHYATYAEDRDCPEGLNPPSDQIFRRILTELNTPPDKLEKLMDDFPNTMYGIAGRRGKINDKPVDVYINPTSVPDPGLKTAQGHVSLGFDLDGKNSGNDFVDPETGERGVDNQVFRAFGCIASLRGTPNARPTHPAIQWDMTRDQMQAWVIEITGIDDARNDSDVEVGLYRAIEPIVRNGAAEPQEDMTFRIDPNPRTKNVVHGRIKNGVLLSDTFNFYMVGDPFSLTDYHLSEARLRLTLTEAGALKGIIGGYQPWETLYWSFASGGAVNEANVSLDIPGLYYALRKMADANPDPKTGQNMSISATYVVEAIPAFVRHATDGQVAQAK